MQIQELRKSIPSLFIQLTATVRAFLPEYVTAAFASLGKKTETSQPKTSPQAVSTEKTHTFAKKCFAMVAIAAATNLRIKETEAAPPTVSINNVVADEEQPFSVQWIKTDLFDFASSNVSPITVSVQQINGNPLPAGLTLVNLPLSYVGSTIIPSASLGQPPLTIIDKMNNFIVAGELSTELTLCLDVSNPQSPQATTAIPTFPPTDIHCDEINKICYVAAANLLLVDFSTGIPVLIRTLSVAPNTFQMSIDSESKMGILTNYLPSFQLFNFSNPHKPFLVTTVYTTSVKQLISSFSNNIACVIGSTSPTLSTYYLMAIDFSDSSQPLKGNLTLPALYGYIPYQVDQIKEFCILSSLSGGLKIYNVKNVSNIQLVGLLNTLYEGGLPYSYIPDITTLNGNYIYSVAPNQINQIDVSNPSNPFAVLTTVFPINPLSSYQYGRLKVSGNNMYITTSTGLTITDKGEKVEILGTPAGGTKGNYTFVISAIDANGNPVGIPQQFNLEIRPAVTVQSTIPNQQFIAGQINNLVVGGLFAQFAGNPVSLTLDPLPDFCSFNPSSAILSCVPTPSDVGVKTLTLRGTDPSNSYAETSFQISVVNGPAVNIKIINYIAEVGINLLINTTNTFSDRDNDQLTYTLIGPSWLKYSNQTIYGLPTAGDVGIEAATLTAQAPNGLSATSPFQLTVQLVVPPSIDTSIAASIQNSVISLGQKLALRIPKKLFADQQGREDVEASYQFSGTTPSFLTLDTETDPDNLIIQGTPGWGDVGFFTNNVDQLTLSACRENSKTACATNQSNISIAGDTLFLLLLKILSGVVGAAGLYKYRWTPWNTCMKSRYRKKVEKEGVIGEALAIQLSNLRIGQNPNERCSNLFYRIINREPYEVRSFVQNDQEGWGCLAKTLVIVNRIFRSPDYLSNGLDVLPAAKIRFDRHTKEMLSDKVTDPGSYRKVTLQVVTKEGRILAEFVLSLIEGKKSENQKLISRISDDSIIQSDSADLITPPPRSPSIVTSATSPRTNRGSHIYNPSTATIGEIGIELTGFMPSGQLQRQG